MVVAFGNDHAGYILRDFSLQAIKDLGHEVLDHGTTTPEPVDFPDIAQAVCNDVRHGRAERGVMVCGTGVGAAIASNKMSGIRAAVCHDIYSAHQCVEHDDVNILCLGAQVVGSAVALEILTAFFEARFSTEEHFRRRVQKLKQMDEGRFL